MKYYQDFILTSCFLILLLFLLIWLCDFMVEYCFARYYAARNSDSSNNRPSHHLQLVADVADTDQNESQSAFRGFQSSSSTDNWPTSLQTSDRSVPKPTSQEDKGFSPFLDACWKCDVDKIAFYIASGADILEKTRQGETGLVLATYRMAKIKKLWNPLCLRLLIDNGCPINEPTIHGNTALHFAVKAGDIAIVEWLLANGASVHSQNKAGWRAMSIAHAMRWHDIASILWKNYFEEDEAGAAEDWNSEYHSALD